MWCGLVGGESAGVVKDERGWLAMTSILGQS